METYEWIEKDLAMMFASDDPYFAGVIVYQCPLLKGERRVTNAHRMWLSAQDFDQRKFEAGNLQMPFTARPNGKWDHAVAIGFAKTLDEALSYLVHV